MSISNNKTTYLISSQVPQFVRDDHETFVTFLEEYYKFLAQEGEMEYVSKNFTNFMDIDVIKEHIGLVHPNLEDYKDYHAFLQKMYDNFIALIPSKVLADKALILKHVKDFYRARGSEKSVRFLLRILLGKEVNEDFGFYYPKRDILRASDGKWFVEKSIRIKDVTVNNVSNSVAYSNFVNKTIRGSESNATAIVETVDVYFENGQLITELKLSGSVRNFVDGEVVYCFYTEEGTDKYLSANLFSGIVTSVSLSNGGVGYVEGAYVPVEGGGGSGAQVIINSTTKGTLISIGVSFGGAGFRSNDSILVSGGGGSGAAANVLTVNTDETYHPNTYNVISSLISLEANTQIGNLVYTNLNSTNANSWISNAVSAWSFANCGPIVSCFVINSGNNYSALPSLSAQGNTVIRTLGILGRLEIIDGGLNYSVGDKLEFFNQTGYYGSGASANVTSVEANGKILTVKFEALPGEIPGGTGYDPLTLPSVNVSTTTGNGANIIVRSLIGYGDDLAGSTSSIGKILSLRLISGGSGYTSAPTINLANMTSGSGGIAVSTIATGTYTYPGRYINDDGHLSSYNFLEDRDYYQNYSYVVRIEASLKDYRKSLEELTHPAGTKLFGQYLIRSDRDIQSVINVESSAANAKFYLSTYQVQTSDVLKSGVYNVKTLAATYEPTILSGTYGIAANTIVAYDSRNSSIIVNSPSHKFRPTDNVYLQFANATANITNGLYTVTSSNTNYFSVSVKNGNTSFVVLPTNTSNLVANTGYGNTNNYVTLTQWVSNSNVVIKVGDSINVGGNLVSVVYTNLSSNTIIVFPGLPGNLESNTVFVNTEPYNAYGNVKVFDTIINLFVTHSDLMSGDNVYVKFMSSDTSLANDRYTILSANSKVVKIRHNDASNAVSTSGNVNVHTRTVTVTSNNHALSNSENVYLSFYGSGDTSNVVNGLYSISSVTQNTFVITSTNSVISGASAFIKTANVTMNIASHGFTTNDSVYLWFTSGDTANLTNGYQTVTVLDADRFSIIDDLVPSANGNVTVYRNYMNVTINRTSHGFAVGNNVSVMFETGNLANISNGIYKVNAVANSNTYNIMHNAITISGNISNLIDNSTGQVYVSIVV